MPTGNYFSFSVQISREKLKEHDVDGKPYISVDLGQKHTYVLEEAEPGEEKLYQKYPVAPFKINLDKYYDHPCWFTIYMDGEKVSSFPISQGGFRSRTVEGYKTGNEIRELAFSLPRMTELKTTTSRLPSVGTIRVVCQEAIPQGGEIVKVPTTINRNSLPQQTTYRQLTKRDVSHVQGGIGVVCREGRTMKELQYDKCSYRQRIRLSRGSIIEELTLNYRSKEVLEDQGVLETTNESDVVDKMMEVSISEPSKKSPVKKSDSLAEKEIKKEQITNINQTPVKEHNWTKEVKREQIGNSTSTPCAKPPTIKSTDSPISIKHEQMRLQTEEANLVEVKSQVILNDEDDDDIVYIETTYMKREPGESLDDSVVYMGDDSCYEFDIPEEEVSVVDLCDD